jgi:hypothetical protein
MPVMFGLLTIPQLADFLRSTRVSDGVPVGLVLLPTLVQLWLLLQFRAKRALEASPGAFGLFTSFQVLPFQTSTSVLVLVDRSDVADRSAAGHARARDAAQVARWSDARTSYDLPGRTGLVLDERLRAVKPPGLADSCAVRRARAGHAAQEAGLRRPEARTLCHRPLRPIPTLDECGLNTEMADGGTTPRTRT